MKLILYSASTLTLCLLLSSLATAQSLPTAYSQRVAVITANGSDTQLGMVVGERNGRVYVLTVRSPMVDQYPGITLMIGQSTTPAEARWYKDDKALSNARLMLLSAPRPADYSMQPVRYFTRPNDGQSITIPNETRSGTYAIRVARSQPAKLLLNPVSRFNPANANALLGAPLYLQDRGFVGLLYSPVATNIEAHSMGVIRDAIRTDDAELFDLQPFNKDDDIIIAPKDTPSSTLESIDQTAVQPASDPSAVQPTVSEKADKRPIIKVGIDAAYYLISKPSEPAFTPQKEPLTGHIGLGFNFSPINRLTLHVSPRYNTRTLIFSKDAKYSNYGLTYLQMQSAELAAGLEINLSPTINTFFIHLGGSATKPIKGEYNYTLQNQTYVISLRDDQKTWQKAVIGGIGIRTSGLRILASYYYGLDPYINDDELSNTIPKVTPFKQQKTTFQYASIEFGLYF